MSRIRCMVLLLLVIVNLSACGFGGFSDKSSQSAYPDASGMEAKLSGVVAKGIFHAGSVEIYTVDVSGKETLLKTAAIDPFGNYSATIRRPKNDGSVVLIRAFGSYRDEVTGAEMSVGRASPLRAALVEPSGRVSAMVTPLTEIAVRKATGTGKAMVTTEVAAANSLVSKLFKVDIIATEPVRPDLSAEGFGSAATTQEQKDYTLALATISQIASESGGIDSALQLLGQITSSGDGAAEPAQLFKTALTTFLASEHNFTGVKDVNVTNLGSAGGATRDVKISLAGTVDSGLTVNGVSMTLGLPAGVTIRGDFSDPQLVTALEGVVTPSGGAAATTYVETLYLPATGSRQGQLRISLMNASGMILGEILTVRCEVLPGLSLQPGDFSVLNSVVKDGNGVTISSAAVQTPELLQ